MYVEYGHQICNFNNIKTVLFDALRLRSIDKTFEAWYLQGKDASLVSPNFIKDIITIAQAAFFHPGLE